MPGPALVVPPPRYLAAGGVWVTILNWLEGCERRYGNAAVISSHGQLDHARILSATALHSVSRPSQRRNALPETGLQAIRDIRTTKRALAQNHHFRRLETSRIEPFVWQHHDLFCQGGFSIGKREDIPVVLFVDAPIIWEATSWGTRRPVWGRVLESLGEAPNLRRADVVICVSSEVAAECIRLGTPKSRILVAPCTADVRRFHRAPSYRADLGLQDNLVVGWVGSFRTFHGVEMLVNAMGKLKAQAQEVSLLLVGDGPRRKSVVAMAAELGLKCLAPGAVSHEEVPAYLNAMDIGVVTSDRGESFHYSPLKLKEYMAAGLPAVAPRSGEIDRLLVDGENVIMYEPGDLEGLVRALSALIRSSETREQVGKRGMEACGRFFNVDTQILELEDKLGLESFGS